MGRAVGGPDVLNFTVGVCVNLYLMRPPPGRPASTLAQCDQKWHHNIIVCALHMGWGKEKDIEGQPAACDSRSTKAGKWKFALPLVYLRPCRVIPQDGAGPLTVLLFFNRPKWQTCSYTHTHPSPLQLNVLFLTAVVGYCFYFTLQCLVKLAETGRQNINSPQ